MNDGIFEVMRTASGRDPIVIFDSLDTIQGYVGAQPGKNKEFYLEKVTTKHGMSTSEMIRDVPVDQYLQWTAEMIHNKELVPRILPGAAKLITEGYRTKGIRPIIITADIPEGAALATWPLVESGLVAAADVHGIYELGSKKQSATWAKAKELFEPNTDVWTVFEDNAANLAAALKAYAGSDPRETFGYQVSEKPSGIEVQMAGLRMDRSVFIQEAGGPFGR